MSFNKNRAIAVLAFIAVVAGIVWLWQQDKRKKTLELKPESTLVESVEPLVVDDEEQLQASEEI